ncbi:unnamed protein product [Protopolystoma xenopodis]|uniref:Uncharacterized protein n=1 Tax=Protopolystoma xenopodis TaxID=117903 RepID=A0A3S5CMM1_9PLAT|nr:unnamed protein product [Protopolystoma xenopodis]
MADPFIGHPELPRDEVDFGRLHGLDSSLWELIPLQFHYRPEVRILALQIRQHLYPESIDTSPIWQHIVAEKEV